MDDKYVARLPMLQEKAPPFTAESTQGEIRFPEDYQGKWVVFFSHPADFTPVCTTELIAFAQMADQFKAIGAELLGLSIDSTPSHIAWLKSMQTMKREENQEIRFTFPLIADVTMEIARKYGMLQESASKTDTVRAVFIIDPKGIIRAILYYPLTNGRNIGEILRLVQALQITDKENVATPANWMPKDDVIMPNPKTMDALDQRYAQQGKDYVCPQWYLCFKKPQDGSPWRNNIGQPLVIPAQNSVPEMIPDQYDDLLVNPHFNIYDLAMEENKSLPPNGQNPSMPSRSSNWVTDSRRVIPGCPQTMSNEPVMPAGNDPASHRIGIRF